MSQLTIHVLASGDACGLDATLGSVAPLGGRVVVGLLGGGDGAAARAAGCDVIHVSGDRSECRNELVRLAETEWQFYLDPGEELVAGHGEILGSMAGGPKRVCVVSGDVVSKEVRLWPRGAAWFKNPVFESLGDAGELVGAYVAGIPVPDRAEELARWKGRHPATGEVDYYLACQSLIRGDCEGFAEGARRYLFWDDTQSCAAVMLRYYLSQVALARKDAEAAAREVVPCLVARPLMAEFWCLLGDCYRAGGRAAAARRFYENAVALGSHRDTGDEYPVETSKYGEYPNGWIKRLR